MPLLPIEGSVVELGLPGTGDTGFDLFASGEWEQSRNRFAGPPSARSLVDDTLLLSTPLLSFPHKEKQNAAFEGKRLKGARRFFALRSGVRAKVPRCCGVETSSMLVVITMVFRSLPPN